MTSAASAGQGRSALCVLTLWRQRAFLFSVWSKVFFILSFQQCRNFFFFFNLCSAFRTLLEPEAQCQSSVLELGCCFCPLPLSVPPPGYSHTLSSAHTCDFWLCGGHHTRTVARVVSARAAFRWWLVRPWGLRWGPPPASPPAQVCSKPVVSASQPPRRQRVEEAECWLPLESVPLPL